MDTPLVYSIETGRRRVIVIYLAQPDLLEWAHVIEQVFNDKEYRPGFDFVLDRRTLQTPPADSCLLGFARFVEMVTAQTQKARWAVVLASEGLFDLSALAVQMGLAGRIRGFGNMEDAQEWLDRPDI
jgi:hypothetical protein